MDWIVPHVVRAGISPGSYVLLACAATLLIGVSKGGFGGGVGVLATPLFLIALPGNVTLSLVLPLLIVCDVFTWGHFPRDWHPRSYWSLGSGTAIGLMLGLFALLWFAREDVDGDRWIRLIVGCVSLTFCVVQGYRVLRRRPGRFRPGIGAGAAMGVVCGFTTMVAHAAGVFVDMYLLALRLDKRAFVGTCARYYLTFNLLKVPLYLLAGALAQEDYITFQTLKWDLWLFPLCPLGVALGAWLNRRMSGKTFTLIIYFALAATGAKLLWETLG